MASVVECNSAPVSKQAKASTVLKKKKKNWVPKPQVPKLKLTFYLMGSCPFPRGRFAGLGKHLAVRSLSFILPDLKRFTLRRVMVQGYNKNILISEKHSA